MRCVRATRSVWAGLLVCAFSLFPLGDCSSFEVSSHQIAAFPGEPAARLAHVGIGNFSVLSTGRSSQAETRRILTGTLAFALRRVGFQVKEAADVERLLERSELPTNRLLRNDELLQLAGKFGPRLLLQGEVHETVTYDLVDEHVQVMINVFVFDMTSGRKVGEVRVFGRDLDHYTGRDALEASRLLAGELGEIVRGRVRR